jgi:hypothetical protein
VTRVCPEAKLVPAEAVRPNHGGEGLAQHRTECLTKPFTAADLWAAMDRVLSRDEGEATLKPPMQNGRRDA